MADETIKLTITADDKASKPVDELAKKVAKLDGTTAEVDLKADDNASKTIDRVDKDRKQLDGRNAQVDIKADDDATAKLNKVERELKDLDGKTARIDVKADTTTAQGKINALKDQIKSNIPAAAAVAGAAIAKFALDGAKNFADLGEQVETFSGISGTSAEDASRWIAVADDYGVSADKISTGIGKLGKALGSNITAFDEYGVSIARTKDGSVDLNQTALNVMDTYNATVDPTMRAKLATEAFGKSYTDLIPLIDEGTTQIKARFAEVDGAQLFSDEKLRTAKSYRLAMDDLEDTMQDLQMSIGRQLIPVIVNLAETVDSTVGPLNDMLDAMGDDTLVKFKTALDALTNPIVTVAKEADNAYESLQRAFATPTLAPTILNNLLNLQDVVGETGRTFDVAGAVALDAAQDIEDMATRGAAAQHELQRAVEVDVDRIKRKWDELRGNLSLDQALLNLETDFDDVRKAGEEAFTAAKKGAADAEEKQRSYELKIIDTKRSVIDFGEQLGLSLNQTTTLVALVDKGDLDAVEEQINILRRNNKIELEIVAKGGAGFSTKPRFDAGGVAGPYGGIAGEIGSEILNGRWLTQGPTLVPPGTKVTSRRRTGVWMRRHNIKGYDSGTVGAPIPIGMSNSNQKVTVNINAAVIGNRFDVMRAVKRANFDATRLLGNRP